MSKQNTHEIKLNDNLLFDQGVYPKAESAIKAIHSVLQDVLSDPEHYGKPASVVALVEHLEYTLQCLWNFKPDNKFHRYWFEVDGCECPKLDNKDRIGSQYKVINGECKYHGHNHYCSTNTGLWAFFCNESNEWCVGSNSNKHRENTESAGYLVRDLYVKDVV